MSELNFKRQRARRAIHCILHKVADIPGGVGINPETMIDPVLLEGTPLGVGAKGLYNIIGVARTVKATSPGITVEVRKGSHIRVGMTMLGAKVTAIDSTHVDRDILTFDKAISRALTVNEPIGEDKKVVGICGTELDISEKGNVFIDCWVIAVLQESNSPGLSTEQKASAPTLVYV